MTSPAAADREGCAVLELPVTAPDLTVTEAIVDDEALDVLERDAAARRVAVDAMRRAHEHGELVPFFQPKVGVADGRVEGLEALVRWRHPRRGLLLPAEFVPLAEETRIIAEIGEFVLREACRQLSEWRELLPLHRALHVSVNLSSKQLTKPVLVERVRQILRETGLPAHCLKLEITESAVMDN
ncbi:MAG: EAL domain-containing protein, partial [Chthoniobacterales bacterium]